MSIVERRIRAEQRRLDFYEACRQFDESWGANWLACELAFLAWRQARLLARTGA